MSGTCLNCSILAPSTTLPLPSWTRWSCWTALTWAFSLTWRFTYLCRHRNTVDIVKLRTCGQSSLNLKVLKTPSWPLVLTSPRTTSIRWYIPLEDEIPIPPSLQLDEYRRKWPSSKVGQPGRLGIHRVRDDIGLLKVLPTFFSNWSSHSTISFKIQVAGVEHRCGALPSWTDERELALQLLPSPWGSRSSHGTVTISCSHCQSMLSVVW